MYLGKLNKKGEKIMTAKKRLKGRIWGMSLLASIVLLFATWNVDATTTEPVNESNAVVPHEHNHSDGWMSWEEAVEAGKIEIIYASAIVRQNVKVYFTQDMDGFARLDVDKAVTDFQLCLNGHNYSISSDGSYFINKGSGEVANIGVYNCKTTGKISKTEDTTGSAYLFDFDNGSAFTMSGVRVEAVTNRSGELISSKGGDVTITNCSLVSEPIGSNGINTATIVYVTKNTDPENLNKVTITNSYLFNYSSTIYCSGELEIKGSSIVTDDSYANALSAANIVKVEDSQIGGTVSVTGAKTVFDNVTITNASPYSYEVVNAQPNVDNAEYSFKDCVITGANGSNQAGIRGCSHNYSNTKFNLDNVVIDNCKYDLYSIISGKSFGLDITNIPDGENYILGTNYDTDDSGPIFTCSEDFVDRIILANEPGYALKAEEYGDGYGVSYMPLGVIKHPTSENPSVEVVNSDKAHFEWYPGTVMSLIVATEDVEGESIKGTSSTTVKSVYDANTGYWSPGAYYADESYDFYYPKFTVLAGDEVVLLFDKTLESTGMYFGSSIYQSISGDSARFVVSSTTTAALNIYDYNPNVKIMVIRRDLGEKLEGQNTKTLTGAKAGSYICKITWDDGTVCYSDPVTVEDSYTIEQSTTTNGSYEVKGNAVEGETVTVVTTPDAGYSLEAILVTDANGNVIAVDVLDGNGEFTMPASKVTIKVTFKLDIIDNPDDPGNTDNPDVESGDIKVENSEDNDFEAKVDDVEELITNVTVTEQEQQLIDGGENMSIILELNDKGVNADSDEKEEILEEIDDMKLGTFINIELIKKIGNYTSNITKTKGDINISFTLPEALKNTDNKITRTYYILRNHEGEITLIPVKYDEKTSLVTFATDRFSTYAIVYKDSVVNDNTNPVIPPKTGDASAVYVYALLACMATAAVVCKKKMVGKFM